MPKSGGHPESPKCTTPSPRAPSTAPSPSRKWPAWLSPSSAVVTAAPVAPDSWQYSPAAVNRLTQTSELFAAVRRGGPSVTKRAVRGVIAPRV